MRKIDVPEVCVEQTSKVIPGIPFLDQKVYLFESSSYLSLAVGTVRIWNKLFVGRGKRFSIFKVASSDRGLGAFKQAPSLGDDFGLFADQSSSSIHPLAEESCLPSTVLGFPWIWEVHFHL